MGVEERDRGRDAPAQAVKFGKIGDLISGRRWFIGSARGAQVRFELEFAAG